MDNSFEEVNRARCFNHTLHLSGKTLMRPFNAGISGKDDVDSADGDEDDEDICNGEDDNCEESEESESEDESVDTDVEDDDDLFDALTDAERDELLEDTAPVRETVSKVIASSLSFTKCSVQSFTGAEARFCYHPINYDCPPCMAEGMQRSKAQAPGYPTGCCNPVELHLRHAGLCSSLSETD
jgi:hypothetical protein